jgi:hypothetical protein
MICDICFMPKEDCECEDYDDEFPDDCEDNEWVWGL